MSITFPHRIFSGYSNEGHVQGIAVDTARGYVYYSFTTVLLKTDLGGQLLGSVCNLAGHLGCITYDADANMVYGSLELKHDAVGAGIIQRTGWDPSSEDSFYLVAFDAEKIDRLDMDAERDGVMRAVYLSDVAADYLAVDEASGKKHRYGCSGFDGTGCGPVFGKDRNSEKKIMVTYGIYSETDRTDNDYQVILQYDRSVIEAYGQPLDQSAPHHSGPKAAEQRYFLYTGNTNYGVQNLEYDAHSGNWLAAVYRGKKETFTNFPLFVIDGAKAPVPQALKGRNGEMGAVLSLAELGTVGKDGSVRGVDFPYGSTGIFSFGDGRFYFSQHGVVTENGKKLQYTNLQLYRYAADRDGLFETIGEF